jgi:4-amino-4-deoxy-L-arabinose transferase-like glycosyltransferase
LLGLLATVWLGALLVGRRAALAGGLALATTGAFMSFGRLAMSDMLLTACSTLAVALAVAIAGAPAAIQARPPERARRRSGVLAAALGVVLGLGFLTKGPIALLLPGLGILPLFWRERRRLRLPASSTLLAAALFGVFGLAWFAAVYVQLGAAPLQHFFLRENLQRFGGETYDAGRPPWYYAGTYLAEGLPWSLFLPAALIRLRRRDEEGVAGGRFLASWLGLMALSLSLSRGKIDYYLLPLYPAAALLVGRYFASVAWGGLDRVVARIALLLLAAAFALLAVGTPPLPAEWLPGRSLRAALSCLALVASLGLLGVGFRVSALRVLGALAASAALAFLAVALVFVPAFQAAQPNAAIVEDVARERRYQPDAQLVLCEDPVRVQRDLLFGARVPAQERCDLWAPASSPQPFLLLLRNEQRVDLMEIPSMRFVSEYRYLPSNSFTARGLLAGQQPGVLVLLANYATADPLANLRNRRDRKRAVRAVQEAGGRSKQ